ISFQELYFVNDRGIYLERDVINFKNNKILADVDNQFDFNEFYESTLSLASQLGDCIEGNKEIAYLQSIIDSHIKKHKENNTLPDLNNVDKKTKKLIDQLRKELEEIKKELNNKRSSEVEIQPIKDKIITKKNKNNSVSEQEDFKQLENSENTKIASSNNYKKFKINRKLKDKTTLVILGMFILSIILVISLGTNYLAILLIPCAALIIDKYWKS
ncbi:fam-b protein, partial [Plasmodium berghei]